MAVDLGAAEVVGWEVAMVGVVMAAAEMEVVVAIAEAAVAAA